MEFFNLKNPQLVPFNLDEIIKDGTDSAWGQLCDQSGIGELKALPRDTSLPALEYRAVERQLSQRMKMVKANGNICGLVSSKISEIINPLSLTSLTERFNCLIDVKGGDLRWSTISFYRKDYTIAEQYNPGVEIELSPTYEFSTRVSPYIFRQICSNGAVAKYTFQTRQVGFFDSEEFLEVVESCFERAERCGETLNRYRDNVLTGNKAKSISQGLAILGITARKPLLGFLYETFNEEERLNLIDIFNAITAFARGLELQKMRQLQRKVTERFDMKPCPVCNKLVDASLVDSKVTSCNEALEKHV
ncbi:MAG TPA: hypothetical protein ACFYD6_13000 [Candidatus Brocadiia bacterium]|nr:hypothetical protein [Candidatus Brocadiales bacterium]